MTPSEAQEPIRDLPAVEAGMHDEDMIALGRCVWLMRRPWYVRLWRWIVAKWKPLAGGRP